MCINRFSVFTLCSGYVVLFIFILFSVFQVLRVESRYLYAAPNSLFNHNGAVCYTMSKKLSQPTCQIVNTEPESHRRGMRLKHFYLPNPSHQSNFYRAAWNAVAV